jgi:hypothetical protein
MSPALSTASLFPDRVAVHLTVLDVEPVFDGFLALFSLLLGLRRRPLVRLFRLRAFTRRARHGIRGGAEIRGPVPAVHRSRSGLPARCLLPGISRRAWRRCGKASYARARSIVWPIRNRRRCSRLGGRRNRTPRSACGPGARNRGVRGADDGVVGAEAMLGHILRAPLGGYRERIGEEQGSQPIVLLALVDEPQKRSSSES